VLVPLAKDQVGLILLAGASVGSCILLHGLGVAVEQLRRTNRLAQELAATLEQRVSERTREVREASTQLVDSERRFRLLVDGVVDYAIVMLDPNGRVTSWNAGAERIKGYAAAMILGRHVSEFYTEIDRRRRVPATALRIAAEVGRVESEAWRVREDGTRFWANVVIDAVRDDGGTLLGFAMVTRDLTEKVAIEEQLRQAQKMEAVGRLTGGVAHDFNNLLHTIIGNLDALDAYAERITDTALAQQTRTAVASALRVADRASTLIQRLLAFSRRQPIDPKPTDVGTVISSMSELLRRTLGEHVAVETIDADGLAAISVDGPQLENALLNLAVNARDAMPQGGTLTIETANTQLDAAYAGAHSEVRAGAYVMIAVSDTGTGMTRAVQNKAFDPFFTTKEIGRGSGLGLSQVYGFVKQSGGHAKIYSELGSGTTVKLYFPCLDAASVPVAAPDTAQIIPLQTGRGEVILVVEDDEDARATTRHMLRQLGYGVVAVADAAAALSLIEERGDIRLVFSDIGLPGQINGRQLIELVAQLHPEMPVLLTSGYPQGLITRQHGALAPGVELLVKPFSRAALGAKIAALLDTGRVADTGE
jgi:PAS domain S-box-containing protein